MKKSYVKAHLDAMRGILDRIEDTGDLFYLWELSGYLTGVQEEVKNEDDYKVEE